MWRLMLAIAIGVSFGAQLAWAGEKAAAQPRFDPDLFVIFPAEKVEGEFAANAAKHKKKTEIEGFWSPDEAEVLRLEPAIAVLLADEIKRHERPGDAPLEVARYYRQYFGIVRSSKRVLIVNGFHQTFIDIMRDRAPDFWKTELTGAADGGCLFFHGSYDVSSNEWEGFACNADPSPP